MTLANASSTKRLDAAFFDSLASTSGIGKTVIVTGGGGFLGKETIKILLKRGYSVYSIARSAYPELDELLSQYASGENQFLKRLQCDISDQQKMQSIFDKHKLNKESVAGIIHCAAKAGIWGTYWEYFKSNCLATHTLIKVASDNGIKNLVHVSSPSSVYDGSPLVNAKPELRYPEHFLNFYSQTKCQAEQLVSAAQRHANLSTCILRPHLIWGPGDPHFLPRFEEKIKKGRLFIPGKGDCMVDHTYVSNAALANVFALEKLLGTEDEKQMVSGKVFFISNGEPMTGISFIKSLIQISHEPDIGSGEIQKIPKLLAKALAYIVEGAYRLLKIKAEPPVTRFMVSQMISDHYFDIEPSRKALGDFNRISLKEGLAICRQ